MGGGGSHTKSRGEGLGLPLIGKLFANTNGQYAKTQGKRVRDKGKGRRRRI